MKEKFDYAKALERLAAIAQIVENPDTGIDSIDKYIKESEALLASCREYLRSSREKVEAFEDEA